MSVAVHELFSSLPGRFRPEKAANVRMVVHFDLKGTPYTVEILDGQCHVKKGLSGKPDCVVRAKPEVYLDLETGKLNPQSALLSRKLRVSNVGLMTRYTKFFKRYRPEDRPAVADWKAPSRKPGSGPLDGIRILDLSRLLPGPLATLFLAELGAEVIKIEDPNSPDETRSYPPFQNGESAYYLALNRSKRSLALNLYQPEGKALFRKLLETADIVVESFRPGVLDRAGLGYTQAKELNPRIIYVSVTGYGQSGPYAEHAGHDLNYISLTGLLYLTGAAKGDPVVPAAQVADIAGGSYMAMNACMLALFKRERSGMGEHVDVAMLDSVLPMMGIAFAEHFVSGHHAQRGEPLLSGGLPNYAVYKCADQKYVALGALEPRFFQLFCEKVGKPEWIPLMVPTQKNVRKLHRRLTALFRSRPRDEWIRIAGKAEICLTPVLSPAEAVEDPQMKSRGLFISHTHPVYGNVKGIAQPLKFSDSPLPEGWAAPALGEDSEAILKELGLTAEEISALQKRGIL
jgi:crotonobetainyl-CoA:carnitine CoA-transferase CaiB-like acyl-CoA transferase/putative sterol carrier protein